MPIGEGKQNSEEIDHLMLARYSLNCFALDTHARRFIADKPRKKAADLKTNGF